MRNEVIPINKILIGGCIVVFLVLLITTVVFIVEFYQEIDKLEALHKTINNLLCDYEDELAELSEVLKMYHELMNDYQIPMIASPDFYAWMQQDKPASAQASNPTADDW